MNYRHVEYMMLSNEQKKELAVHLAKTIVELLPEELLIELLDSVIYTME
jgi:hypothetical protein